MNRLAARSALTCAGFIAATIMLSGCAPTNQGDEPNTLGWEWHSDDGNYFVYLELPKNDVKLPEAPNSKVVNGAAYMTIAEGSTDSRTCTNFVTVYSNGENQRMETFGPTTSDRNIYLNGNVAYKNGDLYTLVGIPGPAGSHQTEADQTRKFTPSTKSKYDESVKGIKTHMDQCWSG